MSEAASPTELHRYEQACDQAIAMCDGNLRSTIKALIMANEYLESELQELQAAVASGGVPAAAVSGQTDAGSREESASRGGTGLPRAENAA